MMPKPIEAVQTEVDAAFLYRKVAASQRDAHLQEVFTELAELEERHAQEAFELLQEKGYEGVLPKPSVRARILNALGRFFGYSLVVGVMIDIEGGMAAASAEGKSNPSLSSEDIHREILRSTRGAERKRASLTRAERWHRSIGDNALRAAVLGANDGLVSNLSLVMGVAGASSNNETILLAGMAGLLAGALSMAMGEWISVKSSQELIERQVALELQEIEHHPELEKKELELIYRAKGVPKSVAERMAEKVMENPEEAGKIMVREELHIDPEELSGKPAEAAIASFVLFAIGAFIPVLPFLLHIDRSVILITLIAGTFGLFLLGAATTLFTGKSVFFAGMRQVMFGLGAAGLTYLIGKLIGVAIF
jgi:VIT1/CCC1 family predicted Fe2+/Mn2+ transporter